MITIDINDNNNEKLFSIEIDSIEVFYRNKDLIEKYLSNYIYEMKSPQLIDEMKKGVQLIFNSDIKVIRKRKLQKIHNDYNISSKISKIKLIDISFVITKENF